MLFVEPEAMEKGLFRQSLLAVIGNMKVQLSTEMKRLVPGEVVAAVNNFSKVLAIRSKTPMNMGFSSICVESIRA